MVVRPFGRGQLVKEIEISLIESLTERIPARCIGFMEKHIDEKCQKLKEHVIAQTGYKRKNLISEDVARGLEALINDIRSQQGQFHYIIRRETKHTLSVYKEIAGIVEQAIAAEEGNEVDHSASEIEVPEVTKFWKRVGDNFEELYDWDISDSFGEAIDTAARIAILPIITLIGMAAAAC